MFIQWLVEYRSRSSRTESCVFAACWQGQALLLEAAVFLMIPSSNRD